MALAGDESLQSGETSRQSFYVFSVDSKLQKPGWTKCSISIDLAYPVHCKAFLERPTVAKLGARLNPSSHGRDCLTDFGC